MATKDFNTATLTAKFTFLEPTTTNDTTLFTVGANKTFKIQTLTLCNRHTSAITVQVYVTPSGSALNARHKIVNDLPLGLGESLSLEAICEGMMLGEGDFISVKSSVANVLSVHLTGVEGV
jgi:hypothetical protein